MKGGVECLLLRWKKICIHFNLSYGVTYTDNWSYVPVCPLKLDQLLMIDVLNLFQRVAWGTKWCMAWIGSLGINWGRRPVASRSQCLPTDARRDRDLAVIHIHTQETRTPRSSQQKLAKDCHVQNRDQWCFKHTSYYIFREHWKLFFIDMILIYI